MTPVAGAAVGQTISPVDAFNGGIVRTRTRPLYIVGLAIVAFAMVLLPLVYVALILLAAWLVLLHLVRDTWIFDGGRGTIYRLIFYLGPAVAGAILVFFMVKPFFAKGAKTSDPITVSPDKEPLLFSFVQKICALVGARAPCRIDVDCQANASASLQYGLWSRNLVLTVGLPLVGGLDMRQFAGVLAHEFGHFAQGAGMRLSYIIRRINFWFARVVYERDDWDAKLQQTAGRIDWRIAIMLHAGRACVWLTRRILWALMQVGHAISCFMLRQMEYDADSYEAKVAGSEAFESTASRLRLLNIATQAAYNDLRQSWASNRLPENLPLLIDHKASSLPAEVHQKLSQAASMEKTKWSDTHPCDGDRIKAIQRLNQSGVFQLTQPATGLFSEFAELAKAVTRHHYEKNFQLQFTEKNLISSDEMLRESAASAQTDALVKHYYGTVNVSFKPLLTTGDSFPLVNHQVGAAWQEARKETDRLRADAQAISAECAGQRQRLADLIAANRLTKAGFRVSQETFGLPEQATSSGEQEIATRFAIEETSTAISERLQKLEPFIIALRQRATLALQLATGKGAVGEAERTGELFQITQLVAAVGTEMTRAQEIGSRLRAFSSLAQHQGSSANGAAVRKALSETVSELQTLLSGIQERLGSFTYPFPHARGQMSVAAYLRSERPSDNLWHQTYLDSDSHVERLFALNYRLIGRFLELTDAAEKILEQTQ